MAGRGRSVSRSSTRRPSWFGLRVRRGRRPARRDRGCDRARGPTSRSSASHRSHPARSIGRSRPAAWSTWPTSPRSPWRLRVMEADSVTLEPCMQLVDRWLLVDEGRIAEGMRARLRRASAWSSRARPDPCSGWLASRTCVSRGARPCRHHGLRRQRGSGGPRRCPRGRSVARPRVVVLTGAGISAGTPASTPTATLRRALGGAPPEEVATPEAWERDQALVWRFYRRRGAGPQRGAQRGAPGPRESAGRARRPPAGR